MIDQNIIELEKKTDRNIQKIETLDKTLSKIDDRLNLLEKHIYTDIESIKIILATARGTMMTVMFLAPFVFAGISFFVQVIIQKMDLIP